MQRIGCEACWALEASDAYEAVTRVPVDWEDGNDPIHRTIIPIDILERASLMDGNSVDARTIEQVRAGRRSLEFDWPKDREPVTYWSAGTAGAAQGAA